MNYYTYSQDGLALTESFEGLRLTAYRDSGGVLTVGWGHTGPEVTEGMTITRDQAEAYLRQDVRLASRAVNRLVTVDISQGQFDALVDFAFNLGMSALAGSTLLRLVNRGDFTGAAVEFGKWIHVRGAVVPGLVRRREAEMALFIGDGR